MENEKVLKAAKTVYAGICAVLDERGWTYDKDEDKFLIETGVRGDDLAIRIKIRIDTERQLVILHSPMPFGVPESMRREMAVAVARANHNMVDGCFDYGYETGKIVFRLTSSFRGSLISKDVYEYIVSVSCRIIDNYNGKFLTVIDKKMSIAEINDFIK